jgi:translation initiation factor IF-3
VTFEEVRVIDENGVQMGILSLKEAYQTAIDRKLDLAIVSETSSPKIAKIVNYGKILYEQKKAKKNQKSSMKVKEIKFGLTVGEHDYQIKLNKITELLEDGCKVRVFLVLKGREADQPEFAFDFMRKVISDLSNIGKTEDKLELTGKNVILNFVKI